MTSKDTKLDELQWRSPEWVNAFGLRTDNVLEYFSQSPFFDRTSNNQVLKMQNQFIDLNYMNRPYKMLLQDLKKMKGLEFIIAMVREPDFWIIRKQIRYSEVKTESVADYYIIGSSVYMAPLIHSILSSRLLSTSLNLRNAVTLLQEISSLTNVGNVPITSGGENNNNTNTDKTESNTSNNTNSDTNKAAESQPTTTKETKPETHSESEQQQQQQESTSSEESASIPDSSVNAFNNLLNLSLQNNSINLDDMPSTGISDAALTAVAQAQQLQRAQMEAAEKQMLQLQQQQQQQKSGGGSGSGFGLTPLDSSKK
ncbi:unnamed protein product [Ambrosiozyma monospora]|uniref:Unnamed protein product n=1 Tax=Ambrosiozyma monospora TaxID=43982 RepID=A0ACB5TRB2_AMBMO|nr:unnamed protein product [Ambrosiozyma monospora]